MGSVLLKHSPNSEGQIASLRFRPANGCISTSAHTAGLIGPIRPSDSSIVVYSRQAHKRMCTWERQHIGTQLIQRRLRCISLPKSNRSSVPSSHVLHVARARLYCEEPLMKTKWLSLVPGLLLVCGASLAHHGNASFDTEHSVTLKATITSFVWTNPHSQIYFDVKDENGRVTHWSL